MAERTQHHNESVRLLDLVAVDANMTSWLSDHEFTDCEIVGPAVLILAEDVAFRENSMSPAQFWEIRLGRPYTGGIGTRNCQFLRCSFRDVGIAADRATIESFFA